MKYILFFILFLLSPLAIAQEATPLQKANRTTIEGVLLQVSKLPTPEGNPYPDCYYTATVNINQIVSGQSVPKKIILVLPGFFSRQYAPEAKYKTGDKIKAIIVPFVSMPENVRQTQQADEIEDVDLDFYFPEKISLVQEFQNITNSVPFAGKNEVAEAPSNFQQVDLKARAARQEQMRHDLEQINKLLAEHGGDWDKWYGSLEEFRTKYNRQFEAKAERWIRDSFFSAGKIAHGKVYSPEFVKSVIAFKNYLSKRNVDLIIVRFPYKGEVVDDLFAPLPSDQISNPYLLRMYKELLEGDVEVVTDILPRAKDARLKYPLMYWYQDFIEPHPAEGMVWVMAEALSQRLNRYEKIRSAKKEGFKIKQASASTMSRPASKFAVWPNNVFWPAGNPKFNPEEYAQFRAITTSNGNTLAAKQGLDSPVLVIGSSFVRYPSSELGASLTTYLAYLTGIVPDTLSRLGSDQSIPRTIAREGDTLLGNRTVCLFPIVPWAFYGALDSPPITDQSKFNKILLGTFVANNMQKQIQFAPETPKHVFTYSTEGNLIVQASNKESRNGDGGSFYFELPQQISKYSYFMIELATSLRNAVSIEATYGTQSYEVHNFYSQTNTENTFIFKTDANNIVKVSINDVEFSFPIYIKSVVVYGMQN